MAESWGFEPWNRKRLTCENSFFVHHNHHRANQKGTPRGAFSLRFSWTKTAKWENYFIAPLASNE